MRAVLLFLLLASCATRSRPTPDVRPSNALPAVVSWLSLQPGNVEAITIGSRVYVKPESAQDSALLAHEQVHVEQWSRFGVLLPVLYLASSFICWCRANGFEREAAQ